MSFGFTFFHPSDLYSFLGVGACYLDDSTVEDVIGYIGEFLDGDAAFLDHSWSAIDIVVE